MAVTIDGLSSIPDLPNAAALQTTDLFITNQNAVDGKISLLALTSYFMDKAHPKGEILFSGLKGLNPNTTFPGQTWVRLPGAARTLRLCQDNETDLGEVGGSDTVTIGVNNLPQHTHSFSDVSTAAGGFTPGGSVNSNGAHTHSVSATANSAGAHTHQYKADHLGNQGEQGASGGDNTSAYVATSSAGAHTHSVSGTANSAGAHTHTFTGNAVAAHTHTVSGTTGAAGGSASPAAISVVGAYVKIAAWIRNV